MKIIDEAEFHSAQARVLKTMRGMADGTQLLEFVTDWHAVSKDPERESTSLGLFFLQGLLGPLRNAVHARVSLFAIPVVLMPSAYLPFVLSRTRLGSRTNSVGGQWFAEFRQHYGRHIVYEMTRNHAGTPR